MNSLIKEIESLKNSEVKNLVGLRLEEFSGFQKKNINELFKELSFCLLTANFNAERAIIIQEKINNGFLNLSEEKLAEKLKFLGHRYPNTRANFIVMARNFKQELKKLKSFENPLLRDYLVKNVKGLGLKEASHFLRNVGFLDFAIIDFHIADLLEKHGLMVKPKTIGRRTYLNTEKVLQEIAEKTSLTLGELDLYLWFMETGKILK
ncbi:MAG: N-glycosylase/DNA lyase [archaeon]